MKTKATIAIGLGFVAIGLAFLKVNKEFDKAMSNFFDELFEDLDWDAEQ